MNSHAKSGGRACLANAEIEWMQVAIAETHEAAEVGIRAEHLLCRCPVPEFIAVPGIAAGSLLRACLKIIELPSLAGDLDQTILEIAVNSVL